MKHVKRSIIYILLLVGLLFVGFATNNNTSAQTEKFIFLPLVVNPPESGPAPNAPSNLSQTNATVNSVSIAWVDNSGIEDFFEVWYEKNGVWQNPSVPANTTSYTIDDLSCGTDYYIIIRAVRWENGTIYWGESDGFTASTSSCQ